MKDNLLQKGWKKVKDFRFNRKTFSVPYILFMTLFIVVPMIIILSSAFMNDTTGGFTFQNFASLAKDKVSFSVLGTSFGIGILTTLICFVLGYPVAYILSKMKSGSVILILFILPMWVNFLIRTMALREMFYSIRLNLGFTALLIGMVYNHLPFMVLPIHTSLIGIDKSYSEAAKDLGANSFTAFIKVILPLTLPGIISGVIMVFIPTISSFAISELLGGGKVQLFGDSINAKFMHAQFGVGSVMSLIMLILVLISNFFISKINKGQEISTMV